jgi:hypothetical protein
MKGIKAFKNLSIRNKLGSLRSIFPHEDAIAFEDIAGIYHDVLEYSRSVTLNAFYVTEILQSLLDLQYILNPSPERLGNSFSFR